MKRLLVFFIIVISVYFLTLPQDFVYNKVYFFIGFSLLIAFIYYVLNFIDTYYRTIIYTASSFLFLYFSKKNGVSQLETSNIDFLETVVLILITLFITLRFNLSHRLNLVSKLKRPVFFSYLLGIFMLVFLLLVQEFYNFPILQIELKEYIILLLCLIVPAPFFVIEMTREHLGTSENRLIFHIDSLRFFFFVLLFFIFILFANSFLDPIRIIEVGILAIALYFLIKIFYKFHRFFLLFSIVLFAFLISEFQLLNSKLYIIVFTFITAILIRSEKKLFNELIKRLVRIYPFLLFFLIFFVLYHLSDFIILDKASMLLLFYYLIVILLANLLACYVFKWHRKWMSVFSYTSVQSLFAFYVLDFFNSELLLSIEVLAVFSRVLLMNIVLSIVFYILHSVLTKRNREDEIICLEDFEFAIVNKNDKSEKFLSYLSDENEIFSSDLLRNIETNFLPIKGILSVLLEHYSTVKEKLEKEISSLIHGKKLQTEERRIIKDRIRTNRNFFARKYQNEILKLKDITNHEEIFVFYYNQVISKLKRAPSLTDDVDERIFLNSKSDSLLTLLIKFSIRLRLNIRRFLSSNFFLEHEIDLKTILLYRFYERYSISSKKIHNELSTKLIEFLKCSNNFFKLLDKQFLELMDFVTRTPVKADFGEKFAQATEELLSEARSEFDLVEIEINGTLRQFSELIDKNFENFIGYARHDIKYYDTPLLSNSSYQISKTHEKFEVAINKLNALSKFFDERKKGFVGLISLENETRFVQSTIRKVINKHIEKFDLDVGNTVHEILLTLRSKISELEKNIGTENISFLAYKAKLLYLFKIHAIKKLEAIKKNDKTLHFIDRILEEIHRIVNQSPRYFQIANQHYIFASSQPHNSESILFHFPYQKTIKTLLEVEAYRNLSEIRNQVLIGIENVLSIFENSMKEIHNLSCFSDATNENRKRLLNYIKDTYVHLNDVNSFIISVSKNTEKIIVKELVSSLKSVKERVESQKNMTRGKSNSSEIQKIMMNWFKNNVYETIKKLNQLRKIKFADSSRKNGETKHQIPLISELESSFKNIENTIKDLPFMYRKVMTREALEINDYLIGQSDIINDFENLYKLWKTNQKISVALHGQFGQGKTSLINILKKNLFRNVQSYVFKVKRSANNEIEMIDFLSKIFALRQPLNSFQQLGDAISEDESKYLVVVESAQNLFKKEIGGFNFLHLLLEFVNQGKNNIFWLFSFSEISWQYLNNTMQISDYFFNTFSLRNFDRAEIREIIESRNKTSGYEIVFENVEQRKSRFYKLLIRKYKNSQIIDSYFQSLYRRSSGNLYKAIYLWLSSIKVSEKNQIIVGKIALINMDFIEHFSDRKLLCILAFLEQGHLDKFDIAKQFQLSISESNLLLKNLENYCILQRIDDTHFGLSKFIAPDCIRILKKKGLVD